MNTLAWIIVIWLVIECVGQILTVGRPREPRTPFEAAFSTVCFAGLIWYVVSVAS